MDDDRWTCGVNVVFDLVGSKWKPTILWRLAEGDRRFAELRRAIVPITEKVLTEQLRDLERDGLVERCDSGGFPRRVVYTLSDDGAALERVLDAVGQWGDAHADEIRERRSATSERSGTPVG